MSALSPAQQWLLRKRRRERAAVAEGEQTLVWDGSFELWLDVDALQAWTVTQAGTSILRRERHVSHVHRGFSACRAEIDGSGSAVEVAQSFALTGGDTFRWTLAHKEDAGAALRIVVRQDFGAKLYLQAGGTWGAGFAYRTFTQAEQYADGLVEFVPDSDGAHVVTIQAATASKNFWWDFARLEKV